MTRFHKKALPCALLAGALSALALAAAPAQAAPPPIDAFDATVLDGAGNPFTAAGGHPGTASTVARVEPFVSSLNAGAAPSGQLKDVVVDLPPGFVGDPQAATACSPAQLAGDAQGRSCPLESQVGYISLYYGANFSLRVIGPGATAAVWNMGPAAGTPAVLAFSLAGVTTFIAAEVRSGSDYGVTVASRNLSVAISLSGFVFSAWGNPQDPSHDTQRGYTGPTPCAGEGAVCPPSPSAAPAGRTRS